MDQEFYMTLVSNNTTDSDNTIALFDTQLFKTYELDDSWYVGLAEISYTKSWFNLKKDATIMLVDEKQAMYPSQKLLKAGYYKNESDLAYQINDIIKSIAGQIAVKPAIDFDVYSRRVLVSNGYTENELSLYPWISDELADMLGVKFQGPNETNTIDEHGIVRSNTIKAGLISFRSYDISAGIHSLYVYCDIIEPSFVGDTFSNVIRSVNINQEDPFGKDCENIFNPIQYHKLSRSRFQRIRIGLYDDSGDLIPFKFGRTKVVLHFMRNGEGLGRRVLP